MTIPDDLIVRQIDRTDGSQKLLSGPGETARCVGTLARRLGLTEQEVVTRFLQGDRFTIAGSSYEDSRRTGQPPGPA